MKQFLVEVFVPRSRADQLPAAKKRVRAAARRLADSELRYVRAMYVPEDETCFYVFAAASVDTVAQMSALAGLRGGRIVEALEDSGGRSNDLSSHKKGERHEAL